MNIVEALIQVRKEIQSWVSENLISKIDKNNPVATGSFSLNRKAESDVGNYSFAEGKDTEASGAASHAEGCETKAMGIYSHTEGYQTEALAYGHAEGMNTKASVQAHTEGALTVASGDASHAEGSATTAEGTYSHAEGVGAVASSRAQHVQGTYNVLDVMDDPAAKGKYAHIVGNGDSEAERSNAHTVAWDGTGWFAGDVYVGGTGQDEGAVKLLSENNVDSTPTEDSENAVSSGGVYQQLDYMATAILGMRPVYIWVNADGTTSKTYAQLIGELESVRGHGDMVVKQVVSEDEETGEQEIRTYTLDNENTIDDSLYDMNYHLSCYEEGKIYTCDVPIPITIEDTSAQVAVNFNECVPSACTYIDFLYDSEAAALFSVTCPNGRSKYAAASQARQQGINVFAIIKEKETDKGIDCKLMGYKNGDFCFYFEANDTVFSVSLANNGGIGMTSVMDCAPAIKLSDVTDTKMILSGTTAEYANFFGGNELSMNVNCYVGADNCLYSNGEKVLVERDASIGTGDVSAVLTDNMEYSFSDVTSLNMVCANVKAWGTVVFGSTAPTNISVSGYSVSVGDDINVAAANETWEFNCYNGRMIWRNFGDLTMGTEVTSE